MNRDMILAMVLGLVGLSLAGCGQDPAIRVGAKEFAEQQLLAEMAAQLLRNEGMRVDPVVTCRDTFTAQRMLRVGQVDLMAEYSGTRWLFDMGPVRPETDDLLDAVRERDARIGLNWLDALGFDNRFCLLVATDRAEAMDLTTIADLNQLPGPVRVACPPEYVRRPLDGLRALADAYNLDLADNIVIEPDVSRRVEALLDGRVDVVVGYMTDGVIDRLGLRILDDPKEFFPPYEAAFVVRANLLDERPEVAETLGVLEGSLSIETMRDLVYAVDVEGRNPAQVAREFLLNRELIEPGAEEARHRPQIVVAVAEGDDLGPLTPRAFLAVRRAFPGRSVRSKRTPAPAQEVSHGEARLALLGAERFFQFRGEGVPRRVETLQAAAVVGIRMVHVIRRTGEPGPASDSEPNDPLDGRVGIPPRDSGGGQVARRLLEGRPVAMEGSIESLLEAVDQGEIDTAVVLAAPGDARIARAMAGPGAEAELRLVPMVDWLTPDRAARNPFLRSSRIEEGTYGLAEPLETLGAEVVLAGASVERREMAAGPGAALPVGGIPLTRDEVEALASAVPVPVAPDPALPSAWGLTEPTPQPSLFEAIWMTAMNLLALVFLAWLIAVVRRPGPAPEPVASPSDPSSTGAPPASEPT